MWREHWDAQISWGAATATAGGLGGRAELQGQLDQVGLLVLQLGQLGQTQGQVDLQNIGLRQTLGTEQFHNFLYSFWVNSVLRLKAHQVV